MSTVGSGKGETQMETIRASSSSTTTTRLPHPHPTAQAFFMALDLNGATCGDNKINEHKDNDNKVSSSSSSSSVASTSTFIQRQAQSLGWRNRYSQSEDYPILLNFNSSASSSSSSSLSSRQFTVRQIQGGEINGTYGTGATVWPAAIVLIKYLERHAQSVVKDRTVLDLGSGCGVTSIAAAMLGASTVYCTDGIPSVVQLASYNIQSIMMTTSSRSGSTEETTSTISSSHQLSSRINLDETKSPEGAETMTIQTFHIPNHVSNGDDFKNNHDNNDNNDNCNNQEDDDTDDRQKSCATVHVQKYWWGTDVPPTTHATLILVADCVLPKLFPIGPLVQAIDECLETVPLSSSSSSSSSSQHHPMALLSYEHRYYPDYDPRMKFRELAEERDLHVEVIPTHEHHPIYRVDDIELWRVTRRRRL